MKILIIATIVLPIVLLVLVIARRTSKSPEPRHRLIVASGMGVLAAILAALLALPFPGLDVVSLSDAAIVAFCQAAVPQECAKLLALFLLANNYSYFDKPFNAVIYAVCIGLGFTVFQNGFIFLTAFNRWTEADIIHAFLSLPGNYIFAMLMGSFFSLAWVDKRLRIRNAILSLAVPVVAHGLFDMMEFYTLAAEIAGVVLYVAFVLFYRKPRIWVEELVARQIERDAQDFDT